MRVEYRLEEGDLHDLQAQLAALRRADMATSVVPYVAGVGVAGALVFPLWLVLHPGRPLLLLSGTYLALVAAAAAVAALLKPLLIRRRSPRLEAWSVQRLARASARRSTLGPVAVAVEEDGLVRANAKGELRVRSADVRDVLASPRLLTVRPRGRGPVILLPARAFRDDAAFAAARERLEALAGAPAVSIDPERGAVERAGPPPPRRKLRPELAVALVLALAAAAAHALVSRAYDPRRTNPPGHVVIFTTQWCSVCATLRECLVRSGVPFEERDVERSPEAEAQRRALAGGGVPVTLIGREVVPGLHVRTLAERLGAAGHRFECAGTSPPPAPDAAGPRR